MKTRIDRYVGWTGICAFAVLAVLFGARVGRAEKAVPMSGSLSMQYRSAQGTGLARAFCQEGELLTGGGAFVSGSGGEPLRQSHPISDTSGTNAWGSNGIGWQAASSDFGDTVVAFAICATP
jgi:hypothetical protein